MCLRLNNSPGVSKVYRNELESTRDKQDNKPIRCGRILFMEDHLPLSWNNFALWFCSLGSTTLPPVNFLVESREGQAGCEGSQVFISDSLTWEHKLSCCGSFLRGNVWSRHGHAVKLKVTLCLHDNMKCSRD